MNKPTRPIHTIFLHCSDSDIKAHDNITTIKNWHLQRGFNDVGYHYFIRKDGTIEYGRDLNLIPASQYGYNTGSIAICLSGKDSFYEGQFKSLKKLIQCLERDLEKDLKIRLHNEVSSKTCPNFTLQDAGLNYCKVKAIVL